MKPEEWKEYYRGMVARGNMKPAKEQEVLMNCGGLKFRLIKDPANPQKDIQVMETIDEAVERIKSEILEMSSRVSLEQKADQLITELRRR